jgi:hypothetical protein
MNVNDLFTFVELDVCGHAGCVEGGVDYVLRKPVKDALDIVSKLVADPLTCTQIFADLCVTLPGAITGLKMRTAFDSIQNTKILLTVHDDVTMSNAYVYCLPRHPNTGSFIGMPVFVLNEKYARKTENSDGQVYFLVCKLLRAVGHVLASELALLSDCAVDQELTTRGKFGLCQTAAGTFLPNFGAAVEESLYGGRLNTEDNTARPYQRPLNILVRKFTALPAAPGNYCVHEISAAHVSAKVAELRAYLADPAGACPGLQIPPEARMAVLEAETARTEEQALRRAMNQKAKHTRSGERDHCRHVVCELGSCGNEGSVSEGEDEDDVHFMRLVELGIAFSRKQLALLVKGYRI